MTEWYHGKTQLYLVQLRHSFADLNTTLIDAKSYAGLIKGIWNPAKAATVTTNDIPPLKGADSSGDVSKEFDLTTPEDIQIQNQLIPHIIAILNPEGQAMCFSESWYQFCGLTEAESVGSGWASVIHPDDLKGVTESWAAVLKQDEGQFTWQVRYRRADGFYIWYIIRAQPYKNKDNKTLRWYASMLDIDEWVQARQKSDRRNQSMLKLLGKADVSLWGMNQANELHIQEGHLQWDPMNVVRLVQTIAKSDDPAVAARDMEGNGSSEQYQMAKFIRQALGGQKFPSALEHQEGNRHFRTRFVADYQTHEEDKPTPTVEAVLALTYEITDIKQRSLLQLEIERLAMNEKAATDSSNLKSNFLANISHEIRTPISGIIGLSEHLEDLNLTEDQRKFSGSIRDTAKFLLSLVNDVLDFSKIEAGHMDIESIPFSPKKVVHDIFSVLNHQASKKDLELALLRNIENDIIVIGDPGRLRQILTNLIGNSIKFTDHGSVSLSMDVIYPDAILNRETANVPSLTKIDSSNADTTSSRIILQFSVKDTGIGIDTDAIKHLFMPFSQADTSTARNFGGTGLGLTICRQLATLMGGNVDLVSKLGAGTVATLRIPYEVSRRISLSANSPGSGDQTSHSGFRAQPINSQTLHGRQPYVRSHSGENLTPEQRKALRILIVEDNPVNRQIFSLSVSKLGFKAATVNNGKEALDYLSKRSSEPRPDLILMDVQMPLCDGYEATFKIRNDTDNFDDEVRRTPIIALTASAIKGDREKCAAAGMDDYLKKPVARDYLERSLLKWLCRKDTQH